MAACERMVHTGQFTPRSPVDVLSSGYQEIQQDKAPLIGRHACKFEDNTFFSADISISENFLQFDLFEICFGLLYWPRLLQKA